MSSEVTPREFKARMIDRHRAAFHLWRHCHEILEAAVTRPRDVTSVFSRALDILFVQAFKSHGSLYFLCVHGHGEDGATIARRILEIAFQVQYLYEDVALQEERAKKYLAWFWLQAEDRIKRRLPGRERNWWKARYDAHKHLITRPSGKPFRNWWGDLGIRDLANKLGLGQTYDQDYRFLSQMAHCTAQGILVKNRAGTVQIRTDALVRELLVFGTRYMIEIARRWSEHFAIIEIPVLASLASEALDFDFKS